MTPDYASTEQMRGERVTTATDVYSLGAVLYELLTGKRAHRAENYWLEAKKPSAVARNLDADLDNIVLTAMRTEPERRYASVEEFSADIARYLQNLPVRARAESLPYRGSKFLRRNRAPVLAAGITGVVALALIAGANRFGRLSGGAEAGSPSIAVLPLANLSGDREQDYFAEGVTDDLIGNLAHIQGLRVISRTSSMSFQGVSRPLPEIARSLGVQTVAEGSVLRRGSRIRLDVRLFDAPKDRPVWSRTYEGELEDLLKLQDQVVAAIASEIGVALSARNPSRPSKYWRVNLAAYDAYLKGRHQYTTEFNEKSMQQAIAWFQRALALDPNYAPAYAGLADCYYMVSNQYYAPTDVMPKAKAAAMKAIELDDALGEAHATLALVRSVYDFHHAEAEKGFRHALELKPSDAEAHIWYGLYLVAMGRFDEAAAELERARTLDPVSPALNGYAGAVLYYAHRYDEVIQRMAPIIEKNPDYQQPYAWLALAYEQKGEWVKAIATMEKCVELDGFGADGLAQLGHMYAVAGRTADARTMLQRVTDISRRRYVSAWDFALLHAGLGERDASLRRLETLDKDRSEMFVLINVDPRFDALRPDPRFAAVLRSAGLKL
jgi:TolB-like protein/Tfp pilus assembly protein PilF